MLVTFGWAIIGCIVYVVMLETEKNTHTHIKKNKDKGQNSITSRMETKIFC